MFKKNHQNEHIKDCMLRTSRVIERLKREGLTVLKVTIEGRPCITVQPSPRCRNIVAATMKTSFNGHVKTYRKVTVMEGCQVQWDEKEEVRACS